MYVIEYESLICLNLRLCFEEDGVFLSFNPSEGVSENAEDVVSDGELSDCVLNVDFQLLVFRNE